MAQLQRLVIPYILDRLDCQNLQGMFVESMRSRHRHLAELFHFNEKEATHKFLSPFSDPQDEDDASSIPFIRDQKTQTRILEAKELSDYITSEFWSLIPEELKMSRGVQNLFMWDGLFKAYFLVIYPESSLTVLSERIEAKSHDLGALASELSTQMLSSFLESFLAKRASQMRQMPDEAHLWEVNLLPTLSQSFSINRPTTLGQYASHSGRIWEHMRNNVKTIDLAEARAQSEHVWLPWIGNDEIHSKYEHFLIYNARLSFAQAKQQSLFLMFIPEGNFDWLQKALRRHLECMSSL